MASVDNILEQLVQQISEMAAEDSVAALETKKLQKASQKFLKEYEIFEQKRQQVKTIVTHMKKLRDGVSGSKTEIDKRMNEMKEYANYKNSKTTIIQEYFRPFYESMHFFHDALNEALGQNIVYTFLIWSSKEHTMIPYELDNPLLLIDEIDMRSSGEINARFVSSMAKVQNAIEQYGKAIRQSSFSREDKTQLDFTYESIQERWKYATDLGTHRVMWKPKGEWNVYKVSSGGDFDEAYGAIIFTRKGQNTSFKVATLQFAVDLFMEFVKQVDSASGMLQGDYSGDNGLEYAAKGVGASFMGFDQFVKVARAFSKGELNVTLLKKLKQIFASEGNKKMHAVRDAVAESADQAAHEEMAQLINQQNLQWDIRFG